MPNTFKDLKQTFPDSAAGLQQLYSTYGLPPLADGDTLSEKIINDAITPKLPTNATADTKKNIARMAKNIDNMLNIDNAASSMPTSTETDEQKSIRNLLKTTIAQNDKDLGDVFGCYQRIQQVQNELAENTKKYGVKRSTFGVGGDERLNIAASKQSPLENTSDPAFFVYNFFVRLAEKAKQVDQAFIEEYGLIMAAEKKIRKEQEKINVLNTTIATNDAKIKQYNDEINALNTSNAANANPNGTAASSLPAGSAGNPAPSNSADVDNTGTVSNEDLAQARDQAADEVENAQAVLVEARDKVEQVAEELEAIQVELNNPATDANKREELETALALALTRANDAMQEAQQAEDALQVAHQQWQELAHQSVGLDATKVDVVVTAADANAPIATQSAPSLTSSSFLASASVASKKGHPTAAGEIRPAEQDAPVENVDKGPQP